MSKYVYDPLRKTVDPPYEDIKSKKKFQRFWDEVDERLQFSPEKVLRLVFPTKGKMQK